MTRLIATLVMVSAGSVAAAGSVCPLPARCDIDGDGVPGNSTDYTRFFHALGSSFPESRFNVRADFDGDRAVTSEDFAILWAFCPVEGR